jgi:hypothetical protein
MISHHRPPRSTRTSTALQAAAATDRLTPSSFTAPVFDDAIQIASFDNGTSRNRRLFLEYHRRGDERPPDGEHAGGNDGVMPELLKLIQLPDGGEGNDDLSGGGGNDT